MGYGCLLSLGISVGRSCGMLSLHFRNLGRLVSSSSLGRFNCPCVCSFLIGSRLLGLGSSLGGSCDLLLPHLLNLGSLVSGSFNCPSVSSLFVHPSFLSRSDS